MFQNSGNKWFTHDSSFCSHEMEIFLYNKNKMNGTGFKNLNRKARKLRTILTESIQACFPLGILKVIEPSLTTGKKYIFKLFFNRNQKKTFFTDSQNISQDFSAERRILIERYCK